MTGAMKAPLLLLIGALSLNSSFGQGRLNISPVPVTNSLTGTLAGTNGTLGRSLEQHTSFVAYTEVAIADIEQVDTAEAVVRLNSDQVALQAAFSTLSKLQEVTLLNYLR